MGGHSGAFVPYDAHWQQKSNETLRSVYNEMLDQLTAELNALEARTADHPWDCDKL